MNDYFLINQRKSWFLLLFKTLIVVCFWVSCVFVFSIIYGYGSQVDRYRVPPTITLQNAEIPSRILSARGFVIGGLERGGRRWTSYDELAPELILSVIASEDASFFQHSGVDLRGIIRAARVNMEFGRNAQGGSTITQQLAKSFVGNERTYLRKLEELVIARRLEMEYSKPEIFEAYINRIYFGAGATGIRAASELFFNTTPDQLSFAQAALLTAMIPAPSRYNPFVHPDEALERRNRILDRLERTGLASEEEIAVARSENLLLRVNSAENTRLSDIERAVWRELSIQNPSRNWETENLTIQTGIDLVRQQRAQTSLQDALFALDQRQGFRSHVATLAPNAGDVFRSAWQNHQTDDSVQIAYVITASEDRLYVWAGEEIEIQIDGWNWAIPYQEDASNHGETISSPSSVFSEGDVVLLRDGEIVAWPLVEGAYASADLAGEFYEALVGGRDPFESHFNRFTQGCRQPGSTFKPIVYSATLDHTTLHLASTLRDTPMRIELGPYEEWRPRNADGSFDGYITLWQALIWSRNLPALQLYQTVGARLTIRRAQQLGIRSHLDPVESLALGASCLAPEELLEVYTSFARGGFGFSPQLILFYSQELQENRLNPYQERITWFTRISPAFRLQSLWRTEFPTRRISEENAFQMTFLLREVVRMGTGSELQNLSFPVAGKTGTTNAFDAWFSGFSARDVATLWIGSDQNTRPLGRRESGGHLALPVWGEASLAVDPTWAIMPSLPAQMAWVPIDPETGLRAGEGRWSVSMPFLLRRQPTAESHSFVEDEAFHIDRIGQDF